MKTLHGLLRAGVVALGFALVLGLAAAPAPVSAASRSGGDLLSLVPADAASVAMIRWNDLRESPLASGLFSGADHLTTDGDAARFLEEAQLDPKKDVDTVVIAAKASSGSRNTPVLAMFEGRFDPERLATAARARGAVRRSTPAGDYYLLPDKSGNRERPGAVAFVGSSLVIAGTESSVADALADRQAGGTGFASGAGLGRELKRVDRSASVWALVDVARYPSVSRRSARVESSHEGGGEPAVAILGAMKSVSLVTVQASARGDGLELSATGVSGDADTRQLLEDSLRGLIAMWRLAVQEKSPELVSMLRKFTVSSDSESVSIHGTLSGSALRALAQKKRHPAQN
jgi:hypothetical protein